MNPTLPGRLLLALLVTALCGLAGAQVSVENVQRLLASDGSGGAGGFEDPGDNFGGSVAISGLTAVIGARFHDSLGIENSGAVYVYGHQGTQWVEEAQLVPADPTAWDGFGGSCDIFDDTVVVGATGDDPSGAVYVFVRQGTQWVQQAKRNRPGGFGTSVAIDGPTFVATAPGVDPGGAAYVFARSGTTWTQQAVLAPEDLSPSAAFGSRVQGLAIQGDLVVVGAMWDDAAAANAGSAYVYRRRGTVWSQVAKLTAEDASPSDGFGASVGIGVGFLAIGSPYSGSGAVYVFRPGPSGWMQEGRLRHGDGTPTDRFGESLSVCGDLLLASAVGDLTTDVITYDGDSWHRGAALVPFGDPYPWADYFGRSVAVDGDRIVVGAPLDDTLGNEAGAAYLYKITRRAGTATCFGINCPCGNADPAAGCANSTGVGGFLVGTGSRSVSCENGLQFTATQLPQPTSGVLYMGDTAVATPLLDGIQCAGGTTFRLTGLMQTVDGAGAITFGPGVLDASGALIDPGETWHFQAFYRDAAGSPCGTGANLTSAYSVAFLP